MCVAKNYLHALDKECNLRFNGYQTSFVEANYYGKDDDGFKYRLYESDRTKAKFEDIVNSFNSCFKKGFGCYQIPESEVPKAKLKPENFLIIKRFVTQNDKDSNKKIAFIWLHAPLKEGHLLCTAPSTIQIVAEISAMERVSGTHGEFDVQTQQSIEKFNNRFCIPENIPTALTSLFQTGELQLPQFNIKKLPESEFVILKDNNRPGNSEQRAFVESALSTSDFTIKVGPPGSGKTTSVVELIFQLVKRGKRILLVASTNVAVDNILEKLKDHLDLACVKRYGNDDNDKISIDAKKFIEGPAFRKTEAKALQDRLAASSSRKCKAVQKELLENCDVKDNEMLYEILEENTPIVAGTTFGAALPEMAKLAGRDSTEPPFDYLILDEASKTTIQEFLVPAVLCKHWIIVGDIQQLPPYVCDEDFSENLQICYPDDDDKKREYTAASDSLLAAMGNNNRQAVYLIEKESEMDTFLYKTYAKKNEVLFADADKESDEKELPYATIIVGTLKSFEKNREMLSPRITAVRPACDKATGAILHEEEMQEWASLARFNREKIFKRFDENKPKEWHDEIAWRLVRMFEQRDNNVNEGHSTLERLGKQVEDLIPTGDKETCKKNIHIFEQIYLPSCMELLLRGYGEYKDLALFRGIPQNMLESRCIKLTNQHRSHPDIAKIASDEFYEGKAMRSEHMVGKREWDYRRFGKKHNHWENIKGRCDSKNRNKAEQKWIENELLKFREFARAKPNKDQKWSVAVLSFYKEQADELKKSCQRIFKGFEKYVSYSAGSVDSFQGHEADIVFLSYSNQVPTCFIGAPNRLNVAITRARYMMVHVGNWQAMSKGEGALGRIVQKLKDISHNI